MAFDHRIFRNKDGLGMPSDPLATDSVSDWTAVALLKGLYAKLSGTIVVSAPVGGATEAKQDTQITSLASIDGHVDGLETLVGSTNTLITSTNTKLDTLHTDLGSVNLNTDTLEALTGIVTETAPATDTASSGLNGRLQRIAQRLTTLIGTTLTTAFASATNVSTAAYATNLVIKGSAGTLYGFSGYNSKATAQFIQIHDAASLPADTAVPKVVFTVPAVSNFAIDFGPRGRAFATGIVACNSSTGPTKTIGAADVWIDAQFV